MRRRPPRSPLTHPVPTRRSSDLLPDDPALAGDLAPAFPAEMQRDFAAAIADHQLRREIIATKPANRIVNRMGVVHPFELVEEEGCSLGDVAAAFVAVERLLDMREIWAELDVAKIDESIRLSLFAQAASAMTSQKIGRAHI